MQTPASVAVFAAPFSGPALLEGKTVCRPRAPCPTVLQPLSRDQLVRIHSTLDNMSAEALDLVVKIIDLYEPENESKTAIDMKELRPVTQHKLLGLVVDMEKAASVVPQQQALPADALTVQAEGGCVFRLRCNDTYLSGVLVSVFQGATTFIASGFCDAANGLELLRLDADKPIRVYCGVMAAPHHTLAPLAVLVLPVAAATAAAAAPPTKRARHDIVQ